MMTNYPKRLIEVDLPIKRISAHARREKSIRHGHISTLHIWWARRPLAACRAVICASLWLDPCDENCPLSWQEGAIEIITDFAKKTTEDKDLSEHCSPENWEKWRVLSKAENELNVNTPEHLNILRYALLDFIADFANWDNSTQPDYLETSRKLTQLSHESLGGIPGTLPLVVDPFAGGGSIPLEALRVGADAFASDLNPVAVLLNKVVLEYIPKYGQKLADEVRKWGNWIKEEAEKELGEFYPKDPDGSTPIAYLWARTIILEAPDDGTGIPVEIPLMRSLWLAKKSGRNRALRWVRDSKGQVKTETKEIIYSDGVTRKVRQPLLEIFEPKNAKEVEGGTVARGSATCPVTGYTTPVASARKQIKPRKGGANDARLFCVVTTKTTEQGRFYRLPNTQDLEAVKRAAEELVKRKVTHTDLLSLVPDESTEQYDSFVNRGPIYGMLTWKDYFSSRQLLALTTLVRLIKKVGKELEKESDLGLAEAVQTCLALAVDRCTNQFCSLSKWNNGRELVDGVFARQALPMLWDFGELNIFGSIEGYWRGAINWIITVFNNTNLKITTGQTQQSSAQNHPLPDDSAQAFITDPPYYFSVQYADLSDFFYVWLKRSLINQHHGLFQSFLTPKEDEIIVQSPGHEFASEGKNRAFYESQMQVAMSEGCRILSPEGIGLIVFAHKSTAGWEAQLQAMVDAGWTITGSWAIDTEMGSRMNAMGTAALASSIHLVCRPRHSKEVGDWRNVLHALPKRIHEWMPRLATEGVVGADAIFACLGPALEIFSRYPTVEKASGEQVTLTEYLEYVWAAVSKEALTMIFKDAETGGLEEDARLTAMWLWTISTGETETEATEEESDDDEENESKTKALGGFVLEFDAARKIAQGLGANLETLKNIVEIKGNKARLLPVQERLPYLMGKGEVMAPVKGKKKADKQLTLIGIFPTVEEEEPLEGSIQADKIGKTALDRIHQSMLLFASGRSDALKRFLVDDGVGKDNRFWTLAQSLSALYPSQTDEKRWVDGVLARKKGLGF